MKNEMRITMLRKPILLTLIFLISACAGEKNFSVDYINNHPWDIAYCLRQNQNQKGYQTGTPENDAANIMKEMTVSKNGETAGIYWIDKATVGSIGRSVSTHNVQDWAYRDMDAVLHQCKSELDQ